MAECSRCGAALIATARFCAACGRPVAVAGAVAPTRPSAVAPPRAYTGPVLNTASPPSSAPDPFARTLQEKPGAPVPTKPGVAPAAAAGPAAIVVPPLSPLASSLAPTRPAPPRPSPKLPRTEPPPTLPAPGTPTPPAQPRAQVPPARAAQGSSPVLAPTPPPPPAPAPAPNPQPFQPSPQAYGAPAYPQQPLQPQGSYAPQAYAPSPYSPPPAPAPRFAPGAVVLVHWADGHRYPGTVLQLSPTHVLVAFPNGHREWVDQSYVTTGA